MNRYTKIISIVIGLGLLVALAFFIVPEIGNLMGSDSTEDATASSDVDYSEGAAAFRTFQSNLLETKQYSFCAIKTVAEKESSSELFFGCTVKGNDYAIKIVEDDEELRQLFIDGKYTYINDTEEIVYMDSSDIEFPATRFQEALSGKLIHTDDEIIDGNPVHYVQLYKNGTVYAFYFDQRGELVRFYYVYESKEITLNFCGFYIEVDTEYVSFNIPSSYLQSADNPSMRRGSTNAKLLDLTVDSATIEGFNPSVTTYTISVPFETAAVTIGAEADHREATITGIGAVSLKAGDNTITVVVQAQDESTEKEYTINVFRNSSDAALFNLTIDDRTILGFDENVTNYLVSVDESINSITIDASAKLSSSDITGTGRKSLSMGDNIFNIVVTANDGVSTQTYRLIIRRGNSNAKLSDIIIDSSEIAGFNPAITSYNVTVPYEISSILLSAEAQDDEATMSGLGQLRLTVGDNTFVIVVTAQDQTTRTIYTINIKRNSAAEDFN